MKKSFPKIQLIFFKFVNISCQGIISFNSESWAKSFQQKIARKFIKFLSNTWFSENSVNEFVFVCCFVSQLIIF